jgi:hypothetical protein
VALKQFVAREGHARVPRGHIEDDLQLGSWITAQRSAYKKRDLSAVQTTRLEALPGWSWDLIGQRWETNFALLERFVAREGHARVPQSHVEDGVMLGRWVTKQQASHRAGRLTGSRVDRLEALPGWCWSRHAQQWEDYFALLERFVAREGHALVPQDHEDQEKLGIWVSTQRSTYKEGRLSGEQIERSEALPGWSWDAISDRWETNFGVLQHFVGREGHARVPAHHIEGDVPLGRWVTNQRVSHRDGRLSKRQIARLEALPGWSWDPIADEWQNMFALLKTFVAREGHARVPDRHVESRKQLGAWVGHQRNSYKKGRLSKRQIACLEALRGWSWNPPRGPGHRPNPQRTPVHR